MDFIEVDDWVDSGEFTSELVVSRRRVTGSRRPTGSTTELIIPEDLPVIVQR